MMNSKGVATTDFIFSMVIASAIFMMLMVLSGTLVTIEAAQYLAFSTSRAFAASHKTVDKQVEMAQQKFDSLKKNSTVAKIFTVRPDWFTLNMSIIDPGSKRSLDKYYSFRSDDSRLRTVGLNFKLEAKILYMRLPLLGSTGEDENAFSTNISGMINREPSQSECRAQFINESSSGRYNRILQLDSARYSHPDYAGKAGTSNYSPIEDNGC